MTQQWRIDFRVFEGPNIFVPYAAVTTEFPCPSNSPLPASVVDGLLSEVLPPEFVKQIALPQKEIAFETATLVLASAIQDLAGPCGLPAELQSLEDGQFRILLGYHDAAATQHACLTALRIAQAVFTLASGGQKGAIEDYRQAITAAFKQTQMEMQLRQPDRITRMLMRAASARGIPLYPVSPLSRTWRYGQGKAGLNFFETASENDSLTGNRLARNKYLGSQLVRQLGFPGAAHGLARSPEQAVQMADQLGFPVVVKPADAGKGLGVVTGITTAGELTGAFADANRQSQGGVIVERHLPGDSHRLAVIGGEFRWAVRLVPLHVIGDGKRTVAELLEIRNQNLSEADVAAGLAPVKVGDDMLRMLARQGLSPEARPAAGHSVQLRSIANTAAGGTLHDCTEDTHPDNREMAESIARGFHLDAAGIDFMTRDISKSWRESDCAVIEVNTTPGINTDPPAVQIIAARFPAGVDGRIPSIVLIGTKDSNIDMVAKLVTALGKRVGQTNGSETLLAGMPRCNDNETLPQRVRALILDPSCESLVIGATPQEIERRGFPLDRCDLALIEEGVSLSTPLRQLIEHCSEEVIDGINGEAINDLSSSSIARLVGKQP